jgi:hypothetical protein
MPLNDCLSLFPSQALNRQELTTGWRMSIATLGEGEDRGFSRLDFDDDTWAPVPVPRLHGATSGNEAIWYRTRFPRPRHRQRTLLRFEGAFLVANVWLNGRLLGSHYGYFAPFSFDISSFLLEENVLAVCIEAPVETDLAAKRHLMGLFNDSDVKPYPAASWVGLASNTSGMCQWASGGRCCSSKSATSSPSGCIASHASSRAIWRGWLCASGCATWTAGS